VGLTIYYNLRTSLCDASLVLKLVETLRQFAFDLPFQSVSEVVQLQGEEASGTEAGKPHRWLRIQGTETDAGTLVGPLHAIAFATMPGQGCESANFGFCVYPDHVFKESKDGRKRKVLTRLDGWRWGSYCKTQYASDPTHGGIAHFLRCHLTVIKMLDFLQGTGVVTVEARDDGGYWESRDLERLTKEVVEWNELVAGVVNSLRPLLENQGQVTSPVTGFPNFEHLEAKGAEKLAAWRKFLEENQ